MKSSLVAAAALLVLCAAGALVFLTQDQAGARDSNRVSSEVAELRRVRFEDRQRIAELEAELERLRGILDAHPAPEPATERYPDDTPEKVERLLQEAYASNSVDWLLEAIERLLLLGERGFPLLRRMILDLISGKFLPTQADFQVGHFYRFMKIGANHEKKTIQFIDFLLKDAQTPPLMKQFAQVAAAFFVGSKAPGSEALQQTLMQLFLEQGAGGAMPAGIMGQAGLKRMQIFAMAMSGDERMVEPLRDQLNSTKDTKLQGEIISALAYLGDPSTVPLIKERLDANQGDFRREIDALARVDTDESHALATEFLRSIPDSKRFYRHASRYVRGGGGNAGVLLIRDRIQADPSDERIGETIGTLRRYPTDDSLQTLHYIRDNATNEKVAKSAADAARDVERRVSGAIPGLERK